MAGPRRRETTLRDILPADFIVHRLAAGTKQEAMRDLLNALVIQTGVTGLDREEELRAAMFEREGIASTGIGNGLAIPHVKFKFAEKIALAAGLLEDGIDWEAHDGLPVRLVMLWVCPPTETQQSLALMRALASVAKESPKGIGKLANCRDRKAFLDEAAELSAEPRK